MTIKPAYLATACDANSASRGRVGAIPGEGDQGITQRPVILFERQATELGAGGYPLAHAVGLRVEHQVFDPFGLDLLGQVS